MTSNNKFVLHKFCDCCDTGVKGICNKKISERIKRFISWDKDMKDVYPEHSRVDIIYQGDINCFIELKNWNCFNCDDLKDFKRNLYNKFDHSIIDFENYIGTQCSEIFLFFAYDEEKIPYLITKGNNISKSAFIRSFNWVLEAIEPVREKNIIFDNCKNIFNMVEDLIK